MTPRRVFERNCRNAQHYLLRRVRSKGKGKKGQWTQVSSMGGQWQDTPQIQNAAGKPPAVRERPKARGKASNATCAEGLGHPRDGCVSVKDGFMTWSRTRLKEKTPTKTDAGPKKDDETLLQLGNLGSESCLVEPSTRSPVKHSVKLDGTVVTRKSRNRQQCSRRRGGAVTRVARFSGSLWGR